MKKNCQSDPPKSFGCLLSLDEVRSGLRPDFFSQWTKVASGLVASSDYSMSARIIRSLKVLFKADWNYFSISFIQVAMKFGLYGFFSFNSFLNNISQFVLHTFSANINFVEGLVDKKLFLEIRYFCPKKLFYIFWLFLSYNLLFKHGDVGEVLNNFRCGCSELFVLW